MKINAVNNQNFEARKFRLPVKTLDVTNPELIQYGLQTKKVNFVKEYSNPKAEVLYNKAQQTSNIKEKMRLLSEMGEFELYDCGSGFSGKIHMNIFLALSKFFDFFQK